MISKIGQRFKGIDSTCSPSKDYPIVEIISDSYCGSKFWLANILALDGKVKGKEDFFKYRFDECRKNDLTFKLLPNQNKEKNL